MHRTGQINRRNYSKWNRIVRLDTFRCNDYYVRVYAIAVQIELSLYTKYLRHTHTHTHTSAYIRTCHLLPRNVIYWHRLPIIIRIDDEFISPLFRITVGLYPFNDYMCSLSLSL